MKTLETQLTECLPQWVKLVTALIPDIKDDYRATDDPDDATPGMCLTVGFTPETDDKNCSWSYQTGDNSFSGGAYFHPNWAVVYLFRDSVATEIADEILEEIATILS